MEEHVLAVTKLVNALLGKPALALLAATSLAAGFFAPDLAAFGAASFYAAGAGAIDSTCGVAAAAASGPAAPPCCSA